MKNKILLVLSVFALILPLSVYAVAQVKVYPAFELNHGGQKFAKDIYTQIEYQSGQFYDSQTGVPIYTLDKATIDPVDYKINFFPPATYSYTTHGDCAGLIASSESKTCYVDYQDGAEAIPTPPPAPVPTLSPVPATPALVPTPTPTSSGTSVSETQVVPTPTIVVTPVVTPEPVPTQTIIVLPSTIETAASKEAALIASLQQQLIELLKQLIILLTQRIVFLTK